MTDYSGYDPLDGIDWGTKVPGGKDVQVYFAPNGTTLGGGYTSEGFNTYEIGQFEKAFQSFENVTQLQFERVFSKSDADILIGLDTDGEMDSGTLGWMNPPGTRHADQGMFNGVNWDRAAGGDLSEGGYGYITIVHELLHGLGFAHPHDRGGDSSRFPGVHGAFDDYGPALLNQGVFTIMTYNSGFHKGPVGTSADDAVNFQNFGYEAGPMALDIALLQKKYGVNDTFNNDDTTYHLPQANQIGTGYKAIWDAGGTDRIVYDGVSDTVINLRAATLKYERGGGGFISGADGIAGGFTIAAGVVIENARSSGGNDTLIGNVVDNALRAGPGADLVRGRGGDDHISGGTGNDDLRGGIGADHIAGGGGNDALKGGQGADTFVFGSLGGHDKVADFSLASDHLQFDHDLWGGGARTAQEIADMAHVNTDGIVWSFGGGNSVLLVGLTDTHGLADAILV